MSPVRYRGAGRPASGRGAVAHGWRGASYGSPVTGRPGRDAHGDLPPQTPPPLLLPGTANPIRPLRCWNAVLMLPALALAGCGGKAAEGAPARSAEWAIGVALNPQR